MTRTAAALAGLGGLVLVGVLAGCSSAEPAAVAAVGLDSDGYYAVVQMCDEGRTFTHAAFEDVDGVPAISWIGRTVEPITFFSLTADPPDNWVDDVPGGLVSDVEYTFVASDGDGLEVTGPEFVLDDLNQLGGGEVIDAFGVVSDVDDFLDTACDA